MYTYRSTAEELIASTNKTENKVCTDDRWPIHSTGSQILWHLRRVWQHVLQVDHWSGWGRFTGMGTNTRTHTIIEGIIAAGLTRDINKWHTEDSNGCTGESGGVLLRTRQHCSYQGCAFRLGLFWEGCIFLCTLFIWQGAHIRSQRLVQLPTRRWRFETLCLRYGWSACGSNKHQVATFLNHIISDAKHECSTVESISFFSDGAASQFKQWFLFQNLTYFEELYGVKATWNFTKKAKRKHIKQVWEGTY